MSVTLKGMTWSHPRGYDPMVACSKLWQEKTGVSVVWEKRSLQDFETYPVEELAKAYDLIVIDHPHVGQITAEGCLEPLDVSSREAEREALLAASVGGSYRSYEWQGRQWAFPIDAATQVQAVRPDLLDTAPTRWSEVIDLAKQGRVLLPLRPPHTLMTFYTLCGNLGSPCLSDGKGPFVDIETGKTVIGLMREIAGLIDPECFAMDPIAVVERMVEPGSKIACAPLIYGYVNYSIPGFRANAVHFRDIAAVGENGPIGSALGGTGIAVSGFSKVKAEAIDFAYWIASRDVQRGLYATAGGQPGHGAAWEDEAVNVAAADFYRGTRPTIEASYIRPRHDGYMEFQQTGSDCINDALRSKVDAQVAVEELNRLFLSSFQA